MSYNLELQRLKIEAKRKEIEENPWKERIIRDDKGNISKCIQNYILYFTEDSKYKDKLRYNEFLQIKEFNGRPWNDFDEDEAYVNIQKDLELNNITNVRTTISSIFNANRYNPVQDYLRSLKWDGQERIEEIFINLLEADDTLLNRMMSKKWFMAAVKRVMQPGCKFDNILIFQGAQGIGKTTICERISRGFSNVMLLSEISNKDIIDKMNKTWIGIVDEMDAFSKKDMTTIKTFLSTAADAVRLAYGKNTQTFKRHCVFIGSTNDDTFLRDSTSSTERRFWIIKSHKEKFTPIVNQTLTPEFVDQLWAEAYYKLYQDFDQYLDIESDLFDEFASSQREFKTFTDDTVIDNIKKILDKPYVLTNGEFNDDVDFLNQYNGNNVYGGNLTYINKIPMSSVKYVLYNVYKQDRPSKYIKLALSDEWEYKVIKYHGITSKGLYRKEKNNEFIDNQSINTTLPF